MAAAVPSPSPFATLLRRSKFASYDPAIAQVYTTYGGHAHRGNWGLKRPLALRRRQGFITIKSVDSPDQQTEWNHGESQVRFIRRWEELDVDARYAEASPWSKRVGSHNIGEWRVDSVFAPAKGESEKQRGKLLSERTVAVPNIHAMSNKEFARYLEKLRKLRPQFKAFVEKLTETGPSTQGISPYEPVHLRERAFHKWFIASNTAEEYNSKESCKIQQVPHRTGGLSYSHTSALETLFRTKSQPGIVLQKNMEQARRRGLSNMENSFMVSFAGLLANLRRVNMGGKQTLQQLASQEGFDLQQMSDSIINMRVLNHPKLSAGPKVVGRVTQGLKGVRVEVDERRQV
jgi:hypothetical protein